MRGLRRGATFCIIDRLKQPVPFALGANDDSLIDEIEEDGHAPRERCFRPVFGPVQVVFEMKAGKPSGLLDKGLAVLIIAMAPIRSEVVGPLAGKITDR